MRTVQVLGAAAALVLATGVGDALVTNQIGTADRFGWGLYATSNVAGNMVTNGTWAATA
jgi:hypothetical protein